MSQWQYQIHAEPVSTEPEAVSVDRWQPEYPDQVRRATFLIASVISTLSTNLPLNPPIPIDEPGEGPVAAWGQQPAQQQSNRFTRRAPLSETFAPVEVPAPAVPGPEQWTPQAPIVGPPRLQPGSWAVTVHVEPFTEAVSLDRWQPAYPATARGLGRSASIHQVEPVTQPVAVPVVTEAVHRSWATFVLAQTPWATFTGGE